MSFDAGKMNFLGKILDSFSERERVGGSESATDSDLSIFQISDTEKIDGDGVLKYGQYAQMIEDIQKINEAITSGNFVEEQNNSRGIKSIYYVDLNADGIMDDGVVYRGKDDKLSYDLNSDGKFEYSLQQSGKGAHTVKRYYDKTISSGKEVIKTVEDDNSFKVDIFGGTRNYDYVEKKE